MKLLRYVWLLTISSTAYSASGIGLSELPFDKLIQLVNSDQKLDVLKSDVEQTLLEKGEEESKDLLQPYFDHLEFSLSGAEGRSPIFDLIGINAYDDDGEKSDFLFSQLGINGYDGRTTLNLGVGYRGLNDGETWLYGMNAFYDHEFPNHHKRMSLGIELESSVFKITANSYNGISGYKTDRSGTDSKALDGNDFRLEAALPYFPGAFLTYTKFRWEGVDGASDNEGYTASLKGNFSKHFSVELGRTFFDGSTSKDRNVAKLTYIYSLADHSSPELLTMGDEVYSMAKISSQRYKPVERENRIIKQKKFGTSVSGV